MEWFHSLTGRIETLVLGLKIFVHLQSFRRKPFVNLHNFCQLLTTFDNFSQLLATFDNSWQLMANFGD